MTTRSEELLLAAAKRFEEMSSPFETGWLDEHRVTLDECGDLSQAIANAIRVYVRIPLTVRVRFLAESLFDEERRKAPVAEGRR